MNNILIFAFIKYFSAGAPLGSCILGKNKTKWVFAGKANILVTLTKISDFFQVLEKNHRLLSTICQWKMCNVHDDGAAVPVKFDKTQYVVVFFDILLSLKRTWLNHVD